MLSLIISVLICLIIPNLVLNYIALQDVRKAGLIEMNEDSSIIKFLKSIFWVIFFEIGKIISVSGLFLIHHVLSIAIRGPFQKKVHYGGDGFLGGSVSNVYWNNTFGQFFMLLAPFGFVILLGWIIIKLLRLPPSLFTSALIYFSVGYLVYVWIMIWEW
ncbi:MAG TPA: hypothetical protein VEC36_08545 [Patescibacteria group bacterium]|nr:hypothetical protein [Patescibacteria group bacterium]